MVAWTLSEGHKVLAAGQQPVDPADAYSSAARVADRLEEALLDIATLRDIAQRDVGIQPRRV